MQYAIFRQTTVIGEESYVKLLVFTSSYYSNQPYDLGFTKEVIVYDEWLLKTL